MRLKQLMGFWIFVLLVGSGFAKSHAALYPFSGPDNTMTVHYKLAVAANISTNVVVVDLNPSTTTASTWPHKERREINISSIRIEIDKISISTQSIKLGVVNFVDPSTGSVTWFYSKDYEVNVASVNPVEFLNYTPNFTRLRVESAGANADGVTPYLISSEKTQGSTIFQTDVLLPSPITGGTFPGPGDLIMQVSNGTGAISVVIEVQYSSDK